MKEKTIVLLAIVLAIFTMLLFACTGVAASALRVPNGEPACDVSASAAGDAAYDWGLPLAMRAAPVDTP